jgi:hypothetical protein
LEERSKGRSEIREMEMHWWIVRFVTGEKSSVVVVMGTLGVALLFGKE